MKETQLPHSIGSLYEFELDKGIVLYILPREDTQLIYGALSVKYGSIHNVIEIDGRRKLIYPSGTTHFLEHMLLDYNGVLKSFHDYGAMPNGITTFDRTTFSFSCISNPCENLMNLLNLLNTPNFKEDVVNREREVILQELKTINDNPNWRGIFGLLSLLYEAHPIRNHIGGSEDSIALITRETLLSSYSLFYTNPRNVVVFITGGIDVIEIMNSLENYKFPNYEPSLKSTYTYKFPIEEPLKTIRRNSINMNISIPYLFIGWRDEHDETNSNVDMKSVIITALVLESIFGKSGSLCYNLISKGLVENLTWDCYMGSSYGFSYIEIRCKDPESVEKYMMSFITEIKKQGISINDFENAKKKYLGRYLASLDSLSELTENFLEWKNYNVNFFDIFEVIQSITLDEVNDRLNKYLNSEKYSVFTVLPSI